MDDLEQTKRAPKESGPFGHYKLIRSLTPFGESLRVNDTICQNPPKLQIERAIHKPVRAADYIAWHDPHTIAG